MESVQQLHFSSYVFLCLDLGRYETIYPTLSVSGKMKSHRAINYSIQWVEHIQEKIARQPKNLRTTKISLGSVQFCILLWEKRGATLNRVEPIACRSNWPHTTLYCILKCVYTTWQHIHTEVVGAGYVCMYCMYYEHCLEVLCVHIARVCWLFITSRVGGRNRHPGSFFITWAIAECWGIVISLQFLYVYYASFKTLCYSFYLHHVEILPMRHYRKK